MSYYLYNSLSFLVFRFDLSSRYDGACMYSEFEIELPTWRSVDQTGFSTGRAMTVGKDGVKYADINRLEVLRATD
jgi:hypothetical protein